MNKHIITIGLNDKDAEMQIFSNDTAIEMIADTMINNHGVYAFTMNECEGVYKMDSTGHIIREKSIRIEIADDADSKIDYIGIICDLKVRLNQESIMYELIENANISFI
jgi:hypothetical protein